MNIVTQLLLNSLTFVATNLDDIFVLVALFSQTDNCFRKRHIIAGQYLGFIVLLVVSVISSRGILLVAKELVGVLGLVPIYIGVRLLWDKQTVRHTGQNQVQLTSKHKAHPLSGVKRWNAYRVALITVANGADNIGVYTAMFTDSHFGTVSIIVAQFLILMGAWCYIGQKLVAYPLVEQTTKRFGHFILPFIFILLGIHIVLDSGVIALFNRNTSRILRLFVQPFR
ncbi:MAG: cadmium resistance transporter [Alicyclobacillus sp.]|nr:cadmium resistance transporter [Alicyclobacillus sp.]